MKSALQPYATAGVAIVGASLIAVTPVAAPLPDHTVRDVKLTSTLGDLLEPWIDQYNTGAQNASQLVNNLFLAPGIAFQQAVANQIGNGQTGDANQIGFLQELLNNPSASQLAEITEAMRDNFKTLVDSFTLLGPDSGDVSGDVTPFTLVGLRGLLMTLLPGFLPPSIDPEVVGSILNFISSPASAIIMGELGPFISPVIALMNSLNDGDGFSEILANTVGAFFNGATLDLDSVLPAINDAGVLPGGLTIAHLDIGFGGLFSTGTVGHGPWLLYDSAGDTTASIPVVGGSIFNSVGLDITGVPLLGQINLTSEPIGPLGAFVMLSELYGQELGDLWGQAIGDAKGAPTHGATPPLVHFPTIPDDLFGDDGSSSAAAGSDLLSQLSDVITDWQWSDVF